MTHSRAWRAGLLADAVAPPDHARDLWEHWQRPRVEWYHGSHLSFAWESGVRQLVLAVHRRGRELRISHCRRSRRADRPASCETPGGYGSGRTEIVALSGSSKTESEVRARTVKLPVRSPDLNASAERFVRSIQSECLAQIIPLGEGHLRKAVKEYTEHYHFERNHQGLNNELIEKPSGELNMDGAVECQERLGGVLKYNYRRAA